MCCGAGSDACPLITSWVRLDDAVTADPACLGAWHRVRALITSWVRLDDAVTADPACLGAWHRVCIADSKREATRDRCRLERASAVVRANPAGESV